MTFLLGIATGIIVIKLPKIVKWFDWSWLIQTCPESWERKEIT